MNTLRPKEAEGGFFVAPTIFGDLWLNLGLLSLLVYVPIGALVAHLDYISFNLRLNELRHLIFFVSSSSFYGFLRNNLSESLFSIVALITCYYMARFIMLRGFRSCN
jgi:hypothetical protein